MSLSTSYSTINSLGDDSFIAGSTFTLKFTVLDASGSEVDISDATCTIRVGPYGTDYTMINKTGSVIANNVFSVLFSPADTLGLSGKFSYQPRIVLSSGAVLLPAQGIITLVKQLVT